MLQLSHTRVYESRSHNVATGYSVADSGLALVYTDDNGVAGVRPSSGVASEIYAGTSQTRPIVPSTLAVAGQFTAAAVTLTLPKTPIAGQLRIVALDGTPQVLGNPANANEYSIVGNVVTINVARTGEAFNVQLRYTPTVTEALAASGEIPGALAQTLTDRVTGITRGIIATTSWDVTSAWVAGTPVRLGPNGVFTQAGAGELIPGSVLDAVPNGSYIVFSNLA